MEEDYIPDEVILFQSFARLLYNSYRIFNSHKTELNYYENANEVFKEIIENDFVYVKNYNKCCYILFGNDENFCGRFSIKYIKKANELIKKYYDEFIIHLNKEDELFEFFTYIFEPILKNMYDEYIQNLKCENEKKLESFIISSSFSEEKQNCSICMDSICINSIQTNKIVKFDCNHCFHYDCIFNWFMQKQCCPICRKEF